MAKAEAPQRVTFVPAVDFEGYPYGNKHQFKAGEPSIPVQLSYAELMKGKGLVKPGTHFTPVDEPKADA